MTHFKHFIDSHFVGEVISDLSIEADFCVFEVKIQDSNTVIKVLYPQENMIPLEKGDIVDGKGKLFYLMGEGEIENGFFCPAEYVFRIYHEEKQPVVQQAVSSVQAEQSQSVSKEEVKADPSGMPPLPAFTTILKLNSAKNENPSVSPTSVEQPISVNQNPEFEPPAFGEKGKIQDEPSSPPPASQDSNKQSANPVESVAYKTPQLGTGTPEPIKEEVAPATAENHGNTGNKPSTAPSNGNGRAVRFTSSDWNV